MLERGAELTAALEQLEAARDGSGSVLFVEGPGGIGKTRFLAALLERAREQDAGVVSARCDPFEQSFSFSTVRQLLEPALRGATKAQRARLLAGAAQLGTSVLDVTAAGEGAPREEAAALHGLYWLTANLAAEQPAVIAVDDAHWADSASLRWMRYLARRIAGLPVLLAVTARTGEQGPTAPLVAELRTEPLARTMELGPLGQEASAEVVRELLPGAEEEFCEGCRRVTGGNPFFLRELARTLRAEGVDPTAAHTDRLKDIAPGGVASALLVRLAHMPLAASALIVAASVLGQRFPVRRAVALAEVPRESAGEAIDALVSGELLAGTEPGEFAHPIVRSTIYADIPPSKRAEMHKRAAELLRDEGAPPEEQASQLLAAERYGDEWVVAALRAAADAARARGAIEPVVAYLERALEEPPPRELRRDVLLELGRAESQAGDQRGAEVHLREALELSADAESRAEAALALAWALFVDGRTPETVETLDQAIAWLDDPTSELALRLEAELLTTGGLDHATRPLVRSRLPRAAKLAGTADSPAKRLLLATLAWESGLAAEPADRTAELALAALSDGALLADSAPEAPPFNYAALALIVSERLDEAIAAYDDAIALARKRGSAFGYAAASALRSQAYHRRGDLVRAEADARSAVEVMLQGWDLGHPLALGALMDVLTERGDLDGAAEALAHSGVGDEIPDSVLFDALVDSRAHLRLARGELEAALADFLECGRRQEASGVRNPAMVPWRSSAVVTLVLLGRHDEALPLAEEELAIAREAGGPRTVGISLRAYALAAGGPEEVDRLRESVALLERSVGRLEHARALLELGAALRRRNERAEARRHLTEGLELARRCGSLALVERASEELKVAGARPRSRYVSGVDSLTASERRVAEMAAEGMSNREIAQALFVTLKTVEAHLSHTYRKLDVSSRADLARLLAGGDEG